MKPVIAPDVLAELLESAPARVKRRLDAEPDKAESWEWSHGDGTHTVETGAETVHIATDAVTAVSDVTCGCLLSPRCLHVLAVVSALPLSEGAAEPATDDDAEVAPVPELTEAALAAVDGMGRVGARLLETGLEAAGADLRAELLRAVHACRVAGLHRLSATGTALAQSITDLNAGRSRFTLDEAVDQLGDLLLSAWRLRHAPTAADVGVARRRYEPLATTGLHGVASVPILTGSGYGGAVTYLADGSGRIFAISDVQPGGDPATVYRSAPSVGGSAGGHDRLGRHGLFLQDATVSATGRVGGGSATGAVTGRADWHGTALDGLWRTPLTEQLDRIFAAAALPWQQRPEGSDLLFVDATVRVGGGVLCLETVDGAIVSVRPAHLDERSRFVSNTRRLASRPDETFRMVLRVPVDSPSTVEPLALWLDGELVNLGFDALPFAESRETSFGASRGAAATALTPLRRVLNRVVLGGRACAGGVATTTIAKTAKRLRDRYLPHAALLLDRLNRAASAVDRDMFGRVRPTPPGEFAVVWSAAFGYVREAERVRVRASWPTA